MYHRISCVVVSIPSSEAVGVAGASVCVVATAAGTTRRRLRREMSGPIFQRRFPPLPPRPFPFPLPAPFATASPAGGCSGAVFPHESAPCLVSKHLLHWCTLLELAGQVIPFPWEHCPAWNASQRGRGARLVVYLPLTTLWATLRALATGSSVPFCRCRFFSLGGPRFPCGRTLSTMYGRTSPP